MAIRPEALIGLVLHEAVTGCVRSPAGRAPDALSNDRRTAHAQPRPCYNASGHRDPSVPPRTGVPRRMRRATPLALDGSLGPVPHRLSLSVPNGGGRRRLPRPRSCPARPELPDPLVMFDGQPVTSPEQWISRRRPELKALFQHYMYGQMPPAPDDETFAVEREDRELPRRQGDPEGSDDHARPARRRRRSTCCWSSRTSGRGPRAGVPRAELPRQPRGGRRPEGRRCRRPGCPSAVPGVKDNRATDAGRGTQVDVWAVEEVIGRGYALATFYCGDVAPDHPGLADGVFPHYLQARPDEAGPARLGDDRRLGLGALAGRRLPRDRPGHRRAAGSPSSAIRGWARRRSSPAAFDERIALVIPHQAGCGGTAPSRGKVGESVKRINTSFPHWFDAEFKKFNDQPERLPFDQNCLVAPGRPRPVLFTNAVRGHLGQSRGAVPGPPGGRAGLPPARRGGLDARSMPEVDKLVDSTLGYHIRPGKHSMGREDWAVFLEYADIRFGRLGPRATGNRDNERSP